MLALGISVASTFATAVILGAAGRGTIALLNVAASYAVVGLGMSLESGIMYFGAREERALPSFYRLAVLVWALILVGSAALVGAGASLGLTWPVAVLYALGFMVTLLVPIMSAIERLAGRHHSATWWPCLLVIFQQAGGLAGLWTTGSVLGYIVGASLGNITLVVVYFLGARKSWRSMKDCSAELEVRELVFYSSKGHPGVLIHLLVMRSPLIVVGIAFGIEASGRYSIATSLAEMLLLTSQSILAPVLAAATNFPRRYEALYKYLRVNLASSLAMASVAIPGAFLLPYAIGREFEGIGVIVAILCPGYIALGMWRLTVYDLAVRGFPNARSFSAFIGLILLVVGLVVAWNIEVIAVAISVTIAFLGMAYLARRRLDVESGGHGG